MVRLNFPTIIQIPVDCFGVELWFANPLEAGFIGNQTVAKTHAKVAQHGRVS